jgi:histidyl-tRNA synthetase
MSLSTQPPKGTSDWTPEEYRIRSYIFDTWKSVCKSYGYQEYLTPIVEHADVYRAKSGEDVGGAELVTFTDRAGRELCIRPEMTPSVTRMVSTMYESAPKPLRLFSVANFMRNERPQRGRNREFWQLNADMFGEDSLASDVEILQMSLDLMLAFSPPEKSFVLKINSRELIESVLVEADVPESARAEFVRVLDKKDKLSDDEMRDRIYQISGVENIKYDYVMQYFSTDLQAYLADSFAGKKFEGIDYLLNIQKKLTERGYGDYIQFAPDIIRGFDYYDGVIFEMFDLHPDNNRAMFGGGRYNGLADIFGRAPFPSIGFAPGDETMKLFLESWGLLEKMQQDSEDELYYAPLLDVDSGEYAHRVVKKLRDGGASVAAGLKPQGLAKAMQFAAKGGYQYIVLAGSQEMKARDYIVKNIATGDEERYEL